MNAHDSIDARRAAGRRYLATVPLLDDYIEQFAMHLGDSPGRRAQLRALLAPHREQIEAVHMELLLKHYTATEIEALAQFQASTDGRAIMKKIGAFQADLLPLLTPVLRGVVEDALRQPAADA